MRIEKFLSDQIGLSRSEIKKIIQRKKIKVNGITINKSIDINPNCDLINFDGEIIQYKEFEYFVLNKPKNYVSSTVDENKYLSVLTLVPSKRKNLIIFGRLDVDTEGLMIVSDDTKMYHELFHGKKDITKTYLVNLKQDLTQEECEKIESGIQYDKDLIAKPCKVQYLDSEDKKTVLIQISEGKFHQVKKMFKSVDNEVLSLKRISIGNLHLDSLNLQTGQCQEIKREFLLEKIFSS
ncbi:16S rRNA pseudouridine(516) synthase [Mycoplasmopsis pullorum]|uniref:pseudouridine synthase n=2 Tax=Mycoplasmopsis pullorum TaxID=48003 RepID=UPI001118A772|nr:pseudouridine synthase [Mycoplasmopsis pullorum]TNK82486.1 16S rRNA pseudouridine(516) synthase [Mycoplasmopsis pullorum]TNK83275.1 16S rRNA pseudouridine(516) synthase [Mycoplasmopsis pullorum]TNK84978.1 16S rRNA pseudouridine(516) synthase [Mycoplasmopsis pullorum]TNK85553.1 16S rRNA pseudouridine(516) synthase [Mycoplasmopsis pullorum]TNK86052.1 16S rRNA pseudouridine(516) synthase [Mycoplasmopsis pullorum]